MRSFSFCLTVAAALALSLAGAGAASADSRTPELAGTTIIEGARTSMTRVSIPRDVVIKGEQGFNASRHGRLQGVLLRPAGAPITDVNALLAAQLNFCWSKGCTPAADAPTHKQVDRTPLTETLTADYTLPKGLYDLYLVADDAPGSVTLTLGGLTGTTTVRPDRPVRAEITTDAPETPQIGVGPIAYSGGSTHAIGEPAGAIFSAIALRGQGPAAGAIGFCNRPEGDGATYQACGGVGGWPHTFRDFVMHEPQEFSYVGSGWGLVYPRATWGMGGWIDGAAISWEAAHVSLAMTYVTPSGRASDDPGSDDAPSAPAPAPAPAAGGVIAQTPPAVSATPATARSSAAGARTDRKPCHPVLRVRRTRAIVRLKAKSSETCVIKARLLSGKVTVARASGRARAARWVTLRMRARTTRRLKVVVVTQDVAGNRARRSLNVR